MAAGKELKAVMPVADLGRRTGEIVGFLTVNIWKVEGEEDNGQGYCGSGEVRMDVICNQQIQHSHTGGGDYGSRASAPKLIK